MMKRKKMYLVGMLALQILSPLGLPVLMCRDDLEAKENASRRPLKGAWKCRVCHKTVYRGKHTCPGRGILDEDTQESRPSLSQEENAPRRPLKGTWQCKSCGKTVYRGKHTCSRREEGEHHQRPFSRRLTGDVTGRDSEAEERRPRPMKGVSRCRSCSEVFRLNQKHQCPEKESLD